MRFPASPARIGMLVGTLFLLDLAYRQLSGEGFGVLPVSLAVLNGVFLGLLLAWLVPLLHLRRSHLVGALWLTLFLIEFVSSLVEGYFFTTVFASVGELFAALPVLALFALAQAVLAGFILETQAEGDGVGDAFRRHLATRTFGAWAWRAVAAAVVYFPIYFSFGALVGPFVIEYYNEAGLGLVVPDISVIVPLELGRGLLHVVALLPMMVALRANRWTPFLAMAALLFIPGSILPLLTRTSLPAAIIPFHSLELLADSVVYGFVLSWLLGRGTEEARRSPRPAPT